VIYAKRRERKGAEGTQRRKGGRKDAEGDAKTQRGTQRRRGGRKDARETSRHFSPYFNFTFQLQNSAIKKTLLYVENTFYKITTYRNFIKK